MKTPVLFLIFNRPDTTARVFEVIRAAGPERLYVAADGPRPGREGEAGLCAETQRIAAAVDWPCEVKTLFRKDNLGCKLAVSSAITWFFENEEEGIILEDDCLPDGSFFYFCEELLDRYRDNEKITHIGGANFQDGICRGSASYYFSRYAHVWGWATWRRAWKHYDVLIRSFPEFKKTGQISRIFSDKSAGVYWMKVLQSVYDNKIDTWDYQWQYSAWASDSVAIVPNGNLVSNIGFGRGSTHTADNRNRFSNMPACSLTVPLSHPGALIPDESADAYTFKHHYTRSIVLRALAKIKRSFK